MPRPSRTLYHIRFYDYGGHPHYLDTIDPDKIGPWLAEMFMLWPYRVDLSQSVMIETGTV